MHAEHLVNEVGGQGGGVMNPKSAKKISGSKFKSSIFGLRSIFFYMFIKSWPMAPLAILASGGLALWPYWHPPVLASGGIGFWRYSLPAVLASGDISLRGPEKLPRARDVAAGQRDCRGPRPAQAQARPGPCFFIHFTLHSSSLFTWPHGVLRMLPGGCFFIPK